MTVYDQLRLQLFFCPYNMYNNMDLQTWLEPTTRPNPAASFLAKSKLVGPAKYVLLIQVASTKPLYEVLYRTTPGNGTRSCSSYIETQRAVCLYVIQGSILYFSRARREIRLTALAVLKNRNLRISLSTLLEKHQTSRRTAAQ